MSTTIDQKVVEMRFDNRHFEKNVSGTMSTLDKLKQKLNLSGASKGLDNISASAKKVDMTGLSKGVESVTARFSALQVVGTTALVNLTNSAINAGKRMISALTIDPVKTGFSEYETQINAVQTIKANTQHNGTTIDEINEALEMLNVYADKTIYNFTEMTRNIGTFTAAGVDLQTSVDSIQGIANLAAVSGSTSQQASTAMYQLSQALAAGKVSLMDWNSVVNAGMGGKVFQDALVRTSELLGTGAKGAIDMYGSFRESLTKGEWLTTEVLTETLKQFAGAYSEADLIAQGFTEQQAKEIAGMAKTAEEAATKVKTFTQLWDVLKESAQSGWSQTWKIIIGDYEEAKELLSPLADVLTGFINKMSDARNRIVEGVLDFASPWTKIMDKLGKVKEVAKSVEKVTDKLEYFQNVVNNVWRGDFKNSDTGRFELLEKAGYDHRVVQDLVNKGNQYKLTIEDVEASHKKFGLTMETTTEKTKEVTSAFNNLTEEQLKKAGLTEEEIKLYQDLQREAERTGKSISELADEMSKTSGRTLLIESFKNAGNGLLNVFRALGEAWKEIFDPVSIVGIYNALKAFNSFTLSIKNYLGVYDEATGEFVKLSENGENLKRTFKGIFAVLDIITTLVGGGFKIAFKVVSSILKYFNLDILDVTAYIGDALVKFRDWLDSLFDISGVLDAIGPALKTGIKTIKKWFNAFIKLPEVQEAMSRFSAAIEKISSINIGDGIKKMVDSFLELPLVQKILSKFGVSLENLESVDLSSVGKNIVDGLVEGLKNGVKNAVTGIIDLGTKIVEGICSFLGIHSPSTVFMTIGGFIIAGLLLGLKEGFISVPESLQGIVDKCLAVIQNIDWGAVFAVGVSVAGLYFLKKIGDALETLAAPFEGLGDIFEATAGVVESFGKVTKAMAMEIRTKALKNLAISLAILVGCIIAIDKICGDDYTRVAKAVGIIFALAVILGILAIATSKMSDASVEMDKNGVSINGLKQNLLTIAAAIGILGLTVKLVGSMSIGQAVQGFTGLIILMGSMLGFLAVTRLIVSNKSAKNIDNIGSLMIKLSVAMLLMAGVCKIIGKLKPEELGKGAVFAVGFAAFMTALAGISRLAGKNINKLGGMMVKLAIAMGLMVGVLKLIGILNVKDALKGIIFAEVFVAFVRALVKATTVGKDSQIAKIGGLLLSISISLGLMVGVCKLVGLLSVGDMIKGAAFMLAFTLFVGILVKVTTIASDKQIAKVSGMILSISIAMGILAAVSMVLSLMRYEGLAKGITAVSILSAMMAMMIKSTRFTEDVKGNLIVMTVAIGLMAAAVAGLSLIKTEKLAVATAAMSALMGMFALVVRSSKNIGKSIGPLIVMTAAIGVMAGALWLLSTLDVKSSLENAGALSLLMSVMAGCLLVISKINIDPTKAFKGIGLLSSMIIPMSAFVAALYFMPNITKAKENVMLLIPVMVAMTALLAVLTLLGTFGLQGIIGVGLLTAMVVPMMTFVAVLHFMPDITKAKENVTLLIGVMVAMTGLLAVLSILGFLAISGLAGIVALTAMVIPMLSFVWIMEKISGVDLAVGNIMLLMSMMTVMTSLLTQLAFVGPLALIGVTALQGLIIMIAEIAVLATAIGALANNWESFETFLNTGLPILEQIAGSIGRMVGAFVSGALTEISSSLPQIGTDLSSFMTNVMPFINGAKLVDEQVLNGVGILTAAIIALTVADMINAIASFASFGNVSLAQLGTELSMFMINALPFITLSKSIDESAVNAAKTLAETILILTAADLLNGIKSFLPFCQNGSSLESFGTQLKTFGAAIAGFSAGIEEAGGINAESVQAAADAGLVLANLQKNLQGTGGVIQFFSGEKNLATFGLQLKTFGEAIAAFSTAVSANGGINEKAVEAAANAGSLMAELQSKLVGTGGVVQFFTGDKDFTLFGAQLISFGGAITTFSKQVSQEGAIDEKAVAVAKNAGALMVELQNSLEPIGGVVGFFTGKNDLSTFGTNLQSYGESLVAFSKTLVEGNIDDGAITAAYTAGKLMSALQRSLPEDKILDGKQNLEQFGNKMEGFGKSISKYSESVTDIDVDKVSASTNAASLLAKIARDVVDIDMSGVENFKIKTLGSAIQSYSDKVSDIDSGTITTSIISIRALIDLIKKMSGLDASGVSTFKTAINNLGKVSLSGLEQTFNGSASKMANIGSRLVDFISNGMKTKQGNLMTTANNMINLLQKSITSRASMFKITGVKLMGMFITGMTSQNGKMTSSILSALSSAVTKMRGKYQSFYNAGSYLVSGFASGISANSYKAEIKAAAMAKAAYEAAKEVLDINSPSKVFRKIGYSVPEGFAMGIDRLSGLVQKSSTGMAEGAIENVKRSISRIGDAINADIDSQPTIRPVLDLSDVKTGASAISGLFGKDTLVGVRANVSRINTSMNDNVQNGGNSDIVSAINKLRKDLGNVGNTTYQINGITYDDGSALQDAFGTIVRQAKIERRV